MSLFTMVEFLETTFEEVVELASAAREQSGLDLPVFRDNKPMACTHPLVDIWEAGGMLTASADWDAETWDFESEGLDKLESVIRALYRLSPHGIRFRSMWIGESADKCEVMSIDELAEVLKINSVGTHTCYVVRKE